MELDARLSPARGGTKLQSNNSSTVDRSGPGAAKDTWYNDRVCAPDRDMVCVGACALDRDM